jgi:hypothetical protein
MSGTMISAADKKSLLPVLARVTICREDTHKKKQPQK